MENIVISILRTDEWRWHIYFANIQSEMGAPPPSPTPLRCPGGRSLSSQQRWHENDGYPTEVSFDITTSDEGFVKLEIIFHIFRNETERNGNLSNCFFLPIVFAHFPFNSWSIVIISLQEIYILRSNFICARSEFPDVS